MMIYNSHAHGPSFDAQTKTGTFPSNVSDPLLTNWTHQPLTPEDAFIGPSTLAPPWEGVDGAYYAAAYDTATRACQLWRTTNCTAWSVVSTKFNFCANNNPELYLTPPPCEGCPTTPPPQNYSYVAKQCDGQTDGYSFGRMVGVNSDANFIVAPNTRQQLFEVGKRDQWVDGRSAWTESMWDPVGKRRIMVGWTPPGVSPGYTKPFPGFAPLWHMCSLLRDVRYDDRFKQLTALPIAEYASLRSTQVVAAMQHVQLAPAAGTSTATAALGDGGRQLDVEVTFALPGKGAADRVGISILRSADGLRRTDIYLQRYQAPPTPPPPPPLGPFMPHTDLPGDDSLPGSKYFGVHYTDPHLCQANCTADPLCKAWVYVPGPTGVGAGTGVDAGGFPVPRCCLKGVVPPAKPSSSCTSGVRPTASDDSTSGGSSDAAQPTVVKGHADRAAGELTVEMKADLERLLPGRGGGEANHAAGAPAAPDLWMLTINTTAFGTVVGHENRFPVGSKLFSLLPDGSEDSLTLRVVLDRSILEAFAQGGRVSLLASIGAILQQLARGMMEHRPYCCHSTYATLLPARLARVACH
jgi:hypothetical protein